MLLKQLFLCNIFSIRYCLEVDTRLVLKRTKEDNQKSENCGVVFSRFIIPKKSKSALHPLFNFPEFLSSASNKAYLFAIIFSWNNNLGDSSFSNTRALF